MYWYVNKLLAKTFNEKSIYENTPSEVLKHLLDNYVYMHAKVIVTVYASKCLLNQKSWHKNWYKIFPMKNHVALHRSLMQENTYEGSDTNFSVKFQQLNMLW